MTAETKIFPSSHEMRSRGPNLESPNFYSHLGKETDKIIIFLAGGLREAHSPNPWIGPWLCTWDGELLGLVRRNDHRSELVVQTLLLERLQSLVDVSALGGEPVLHSVARHGAGPLSFRRLWRKNKHADCLKNELEEKDKTKAKWNGTVC